MAAVLVLSLFWLIVKGPSWGPRSPFPHDHSGYGVELGENEVASATWQPCNARVGKSMLGEKVRS